jgi:hypothetical protein
MHVILAGLLLGMGVPYISQVTVMPFLAFAIGVDDIYVMLGVSVCTVIFIHYNRQ